MQAWPWPAAVMEPSDLIFPDIVIEFALANMFTFRCDQLKGEWRMIKQWVYLPG